MAADMATATETITMIDLINFAISILVIRGRQGKQDKKNPKGPYRTFRG